MPTAGDRPGFVHLHNHSHYSLLDGLSKVPSMIERIKEMGMSALALTDHGTLSGAVEFYKEAIKAEIKPIIGVEAYVAPRSLGDKTGKADANPNHLILLAETNEGYQNLMKLVTISHLEGFYYKPRVDKELLAKHSNGLIALSACASGEVAKHILNGSLDQAEECVNWYQQTFGKDNYYLELQDHEEWATQQEINKGLLELHRRTNVPLVVTADSHYCRKEDAEAHEVLLCVQTGKTIGDTDRMEMEMALYISDPADIGRRWKHIPEALANTVKIAERCQVELAFGQSLFPVFEIESGEPATDYLRRLSFQGLGWRYGAIPKEDIATLTEKKVRALVKPETIERLEYELGVIKKMGYESYFLIVADFVNWGKNQGIIFGPGRGSAAGSILAYALNITDLDPLAYDLMFERFLNPDRVSMPDIDIDIQDNRRGEVIDYVTQKYGEDRVAQIITFGTMAARNAVRDTGRALGMAYGEVDRIAKLIPQPVQGRHVPLAASAGIIKSDNPEHQPHPELVKEYKSSPTAKRLIDLATKLEGTIRSNGVHAAGVVIGPAELSNFTPLQRAQKGGVATQYSMGPIEDIGLLKMDFLGLSNLTIIKNALRIIKKTHSVNLDPSEIPLEDKKTFELLTRGDTTGIFQLESAGMKRYIKELRPTTLEDIIAMVALYRPGPMQWIDEFIACKHGKREIVYAHPSMESALRTTYGVILYQEQVMQISKDLCGFTGGQADALRKAIGKKKPKEMAKMKVAFIEGAESQSGMKKAESEKLWKRLEDFAAYCFNKSHAACYALIAYQTAYLKAHYPAAFMAALMTSDQDNIERIAIEVDECRRMGIEVLPPDVNHSFLEFGVMAETGQIRFGLGAIKNLGVATIQSILNIREQGPFISLEDFARRVPSGDLNKKSWESLIKAGAVDELGSRDDVLANLDLVMAYAAKYQKNALSGQIDIFGSLGTADSTPKLHLTPAEPVPLQSRLLWEKEHLGLYLSHHPLDDFADYFASQFTPLATLKDLKDGQSVKVGGIVTRLRKILTKRQDVMAFVALGDKSAEVELIVFPQAYNKRKTLWEVDQIIQVKGKVSFKTRDGQQGEEVKILVDDAAAVDLELSRLSPPKASVDAVEIKLESLADSKLLVRLKELLAKYPGETPVYLILGDPGSRILLPFKVSKDEELDKALQELVI